MRPPPAAPHPGPAGCPGIALTVGPLLRGVVALARVRWSGARGAWWRRTAAEVTRTAAVMTYSTVRWRAGVPRRGGDAPHGHAHLPSGRTALVGHGLGALDVTILGWRGRPADVARWGRLLSRAAPLAEGGWGWSALACVRERNGRTMARFTPRMNLNFDVFDSVIHSAQPRRGPWPSDRIMKYQSQ